MKEEEKILVLCISLNYEGEKLRNRDILVVLPYFIKISIKRPVFR